MIEDIRFRINTLEEEKQTVESYKDSVDFFQKHGIRFTVPSRPIEEEYDVKFYQEYLAIAQESWKKQAGNFMENLWAFFNSPDLSDFVVRITQYGPLGSYVYGDRSVFINRNAKIEPAKIIKHEMIHIMVDPFVKGQSLNHKQKEFIVETLGNMFESVNGISDL